MLRFSYGGYQQSRRVPSVAIWLDPHAGLYQLCICLIAAVIDDLSSLSPLFGSWPVASSFARRSWTLLCRATHEKHIHSLRLKLRFRLGSGAGASPYCLLTTAKARGSFRLHGLCATSATRLIYDIDNVYASVEADGDAGLHEGAAIVGRSE